MNLFPATIGTICGREIQDYLPAEDCMLGKIGIITVAPNSSNIGRPVIIGWTKAGYDDEKAVYYLDTAGWDPACDRRVRDLRPNESILIQPK